MPSSIPDGPKLPPVEWSSERYRGRRLTDTERASLLDYAMRRYDEGADCRMIAGEAGTAYGTVRTMLINAGVQLRPHGDWSRAHKVRKAQAGGASE